MAISTPKVPRKRRRIWSSQIVNEFAAKPAERATVKVIDVQPQMEFGIGD
jgi:hypothetical protein